LVELGLPELTTTQIEALCETAENVARNYIYDKICSKLIDCLDITVEAKGTKPVDLSVEVHFVLTSDAKNVDANAIAEEAVVQAHLASETFLRKLV